MRIRHALLLAAVALLGTLPSAPAGADDPAWSAVDAARDALTDARWEVRFTQTFIPAGFSSGETETGSATLGLPDALRWDYDTPFPRTYLVVRDTVYTWNAGEASGRRFALGDEEARHLELLRLDAERLRERYEATLEDGVGGDAVTVVLQPLAEGARIVEATLVLDRATGRPSSLAYRDREGNSTRFELSEHAPTDATGRFAPPDDLEWIDS